MIQPFSSRPRLSPRMQKRKSSVKRERGVESNFSGGASVYLEKESVLTLKLGAFRAAAHRSQRAREPERRTFLDFTLPEAETRSEPSVILRALSLSLGSAVSETKRFSLAIKVAQRGSAQKRTRSEESERGFPTSPWKLPRGLLRGCELAEVPRERAITRGQRAARAVPLSLLLLILAAACVSRSHHPDAQSTVTSPTLFRAEQFSRAKSPED